MAECEEEPYHQQLVKPAGKYPVPLPEQADTPHLCGDHTADFAVRSRIDLLDYDPQPDGTSFRAGSTRSGLDCALRGSAGWTPTIQTPIGSTSDVTFGCLSYT